MQEVVIPDAARIERMENELVTLKNTVTALTVRLEMAQRIASNQAKTMGMIMEMVRQISSTGKFSAGGAS